MLSSTSVTVPTWGQRPGVPRLSKGLDAARAGPRSFQGESSMLIPEKRIRREAIRFALEVSKWAKARGMPWTASRQWKRAEALRRGAAILNPECREACEDRLMQADLKGTK